MNKLSNCPLCGNSLFKDQCFEPAPEDDQPHFRYVEHGDCWTTEIVINSTWFKVNHKYNWTEIFNFNHNKQHWIYLKTLDFTINYFTSQDIEHLKMMMNFI